MVAHRALTYEQREILKKRRQRLAELLPSPVLLWAGGRSPRNFSHNVYPYRASSHFLYFAGIPIEQAVIRLQGGRLELFVEDPSPASALWHGPSLTREELAAQIGADAAYPLSGLGSFSGEALTLGVQDAATRIQQSHILKRGIPAAPDLHPQDEPLAEAMVQLRLCQDSFALEEMRAAAAVTVEAHKAGMAAGLGAKCESEVRAA
ncbi:MAG: aminopeptidase P N-terminal domain-containing protein, partial [Thermostichus sp. DG02_5_bins_236]